MLNQSVRAIALLLALVTPFAGVKAQSFHRFRVEVPFHFVLNGQTLPRGTYFVERTDPTRPNLLTLKKADGGIVRAVIAQRVEQDSPSTASSLVFVYREGKRYLFQVWNVGAMSGVQIPSAKESGKRQSQAATLLTLRARH